jgi:hypothetical protein
LSGIEVEVARNKTGKGTSNLRQVEDKPIHAEARAGCKDGSNGRVRFLHRVPLRDANR